MMARQKAGGGTRVKSLPNLLNATALTLCTTKVDELHE
jgi:hypothetical protein